VSELQVLATGPLALVQDLGRPGLASQGVGRSGAADRAALRLANRLVANAEGAAGIEVLFGGLRVRAEDDLVVALAGASGRAELDGALVGHHAVVRVAAGSELSLGTPAAGLRTYLAVRGGIDVTAVLGSRSTDTLSGIGPPPLGAGMVLPVGPAPAAYPTVEHAPVAAPTNDEVLLHAMLGPRADWVRNAEQLATTAWTASGRSDRWACGWKAWRWSAPARMSCPVRGWCVAPYRCRPPVRPRCSSLITRSPVGTRWSLWCSTPTWTARPRCAPASGCASRL